MRQALVLLVLWLFLACDFDTPATSQLLDFNAPVNFFDVNRVSTSIARVGSEVDYTDSLNWSIENNMFEVEVLTEISTINGIDFFVNQPNFTITLETIDEFSMTGVDSLVSVFDAEILNYNNHYDRADRLVVASSHIEYKTEDDEDFIAVFNMDSLKSVDLDLKLRYVITLAPGYNYPFGEIPTSSYFINLAQYRLRINLLGFYLE